MGVSPAEFYDLTLYEYRCLIARRMFENAHKWEHSRMIAYTVVKANGGCKDTSIQEFMPLLTDPLPKEVKLMTDDEKMALKARAEERIRAFGNQVKK